MTTIPSDVIVVYLRDIYMVRDLYHKHQVTLGGLDIDCAILGISVRLYRREYVWGNILKEVAGSLQAI